MPDNHSEPKRRRQSGSQRGKPGARSPARSFCIVGVGASAGGIEAFGELIRALPPDIGMALVLIQHLDPTRESMLVEVLARNTRLPVSEVQDGTRIQPNRIYVNPPEKLVGISGSTLQLFRRENHQGPERSIDHFLRRLAQDQGHQAIGVILSGAATDGTLGIQEIKAAGGITFAQDSTARLDSMPRSAIASGSVDFVLPPAGIAAELLRISEHPYISVQTDESADAPTVHDIAPILNMLHKARGVDFSHYKHNTLYRRVARRMLLNEVDTVEGYAEVLQEQSKEVDALFQDVLINVTSFFRDPVAFEALKRDVFSKITNERSRHDAVRIWVLGCSTGEEAYSIAMAFAEYSSDAGIEIPVQVFATDLNAAGIDKARAGVYPRNIEQDVSSERLRRFFSEIDGSYRVRKSIRDACVFARHNVLTEPPFSHLDLISCRNMLIYLDGHMQQYVLPVLHYALKPAGFLWLGHSETIGTHRDLFDAEDAKQKIYRKRPGNPRIAFGAHRSALPDAPSTTARQPRPMESSPVPVDSLRESERVLLTKYAPPSVLIDSNFDILQFRGDTGVYLAPSSGKASLNLLKMLREGLVVAVRGALQKARREEMPVREENLRVRSNGGYREVDIEIVPIKQTTQREGCYLVLFENRPLDGTRPDRHGSEPITPNVVEDSAQEVVRLNHELRATREYLQSVVEQQEAANEELQSANEEVQSANEELQSINEELETSKEEIQSSNEELATVNEELHNRNLELSRINNDLVNLLSSVQMAIVMLGPDLRIRRFTPMAEKMMNLIAADLGRPIRDLHMQIDIENLEGKLEEVIDTVSVKEYEVRDKLGRWYSLRLRPYRTLENKIDGAVIVLVDIDTLKRSQAVADRQAQLLERSHEPIIMWDADGKVTYWNRGAEAVYGYPAGEVLGRNHHALLKSPLSTETLRSKLQERNEITEEIAHTAKNGQRIEVESQLMLVHEPDGNRVVIEMNRPIGERKQMEQALRERAEQLTTADRAKDEFLAMLAHELRNPLAPLRNACAILDRMRVTDPEIVKVRDMITRQVAIMTRMVDDLLDVARMAGRGIQLTRSIVDIGELANKAVEGAQFQVRIRDQTLKFSKPEQPVHVQGDSVRLEQMLTNLLNNASKFSLNGGNIWLTIRSTPPPRPESSGWIEISVRDDGIGIPADVLPRIFDLFMQAEQTLDRARGGLGIGLTLVKRLVEMHDGSVEVRSDGVGLGSEFIVRLPAALPEQEEVHPTASVPASTAVAAAPQQRRILIVDDNVDAATSMRLLLTLDDHEVALAHDGSTAISTARNFKPEVILLDIGLPGKNGYQVAREIREDPSLKNIYLVALTGYGQQHHRTLAQEAGFNQYLVKPIELDTIRELLANPNNPD